VNQTSTQLADEGVWDRLRRRKLVQWGVAYAAGAWGFQQGVAYVSTLLDWPVQVQRLTGLALLIGLPIALVLAWYHGDRGQRQVTRSELAILTLLFLLGGGVFWYFQRASETPTVAAQTPPGAATFATDASITVLPFVNMSADKEQEYFADGISEELLNLLAQVPELRVIARTSSFSFKGKEVGIAEIARALNVANVLEGSVRKAGDTIRITAQLIRASDSSHLWSQTYDRQMTDVFRVQDEIAATVVSQLKIKLLGTTPKLTPTDSRAYALYLQAREVARNFDAPALERAIHLYEQALDIDNSYAPAWDGLADTYFNQYDFGVMLAHDALPLARSAVDRALASDRHYAPAHGRAALIEGVMAGDLAEAARHIEQGLALDPVNLELLRSAVYVARPLGRLDKAIALGEYLLDRDPFSELSHDRLAMAYLFGNRLDDALREFRTVIKLRPEFSGERFYIGRVLVMKGDPRGALAEVQKESVESWRLWGLSIAYQALGDQANADAALEEFISKYESTFPYQIATVMAYRNEVDRAFEWIDVSVKRGDAIMLAVDPLMHNLHADKHWLPLLRRFGLAPEQLAAIKFDVKVPN
jgi:TolB-like protein